MLKLNALIFALSAVAGTVSHELGHYIAASILHYQPTLHYSYVTCLLPVDDANLDIRNPANVDAILILLAGPLTTIVIALIGSVFVHRNSAFFFYLSLFWLRFPFNLAAAVFGEMRFPDGSYYGGDELLLSKAFGLYTGTFSLLLGITGIIFLIRSFLIFVGPQDRIKFLVTGFTGGVIGYVIWFVWIGPVLLP